ncbi:MAG: hypothetical protein AAFX05_14580 [Planctomycetota bacterium]
MSEHVQTFTREFLFAVLSLWARALVMLWSVIACCVALWHMTTIDAESAIERVMTSLGAGMWWASICVALGSVVLLPLVTLHEYHARGG